MLALVVNHLHTNKLETKDFFRCAYVWRFGSDISSDALCNDVKRYKETMFLPDYVVKYTIALYGVQ